MSNLSLPLPPTIVPFLGIKLDCSTSQHAPIKMTKGRWRKLPPRLSELKNSSPIGKLSTYCTVRSRIHC